MRVRRPAAIRFHQAALTSRLLWLRRLVLIGGAVAVGLAAVLFAEASDLAQAGYRAVATAEPLLVLLLTPAGFGLCAWLTRRWFNGAQGSGIPQAIAARRSRDPGHRRRLLGLRVTTGKILLTVAGLAVGASIGREGPTVQIGASIMLGIGGLAGIGRQPGLVLAGAAAGVAGAFNTPLAGIVFAIEEMAKAYEKRIAGLVIAAVVIAALVSILLEGNYRYFGVVTGAFGRGRDWLAIPACALIGGGFGGLFSRGVGAVALARRGWIGRLRRRPVLFAAGCGLGAALLALATGGYAAGTGYAATRSILDDGVLLPLWYAPAKLASTLLSSVSGIPGGLFSPSLTVGAGFGALAAGILGSGQIQTMSLLSMAGYFAGVVQAPLTAFVIVLEMTAQSDMTVPLLATTFLASALSRLISPEPLYHRLSHLFDPPAPGTAGAAPSGTFA